MMGRIRGALIRVKSKLAFGRQFDPYLMAGCLCTLAAPFDVFWDAALTQS